MCRGHPKHHRCAHTSVSWYYCPSAHLDMFTGAVSPCGNPIMSDSQPTKAGCPLQHCRFAAKGGSGAGGGWVCCQCGRGPNTRGWCAQRMTAAQVVGLDPGEEVLAGQLQATCDHGCCDDCTGTEEVQGVAGVARGWRASSSACEGASSPGSASEGTSNTWASSPPSSKAGSDDGGSDRGRYGGKERAGGKKGSSKRR